MADLAVDNILDLRTTNPEKSAWKVTEIVEPPSGENGETVVRLVTHPALSTTPVPPPDRS